MADGRQKVVVTELADLASRTNYAVDLVSNLREPLGKGDTIETPSIGKLQVAASGSAQNVAQNPVLSTLVLYANLDPAIFVNLPALHQVQLLDGTWGKQVAKQGIIQLKGDMDSALCTYCATQIARYTATSMNHINPAGGAVTSRHLAKATAALLSNDGAALENTVILAHPFLVAEIQTVPGFVSQYKDLQPGHLGVPQVGAVNGARTFMSNSVPRLRTLASTAWDRSDNTISITLGADHGIVPGCPVRFTTATPGARIGSDTPVIDVTATTIVVAQNGSAADANEAGEVQIRACENLILDIAHVFVAQQKMPGTRIVPKLGSTGDELQVDSIWGRVAREGRAKIIYSPYSVDD